MKGRISSLAMYHFRIKSDKKTNGTKISAVQHVEYINREGKFSTPEQWQEKNKFVGDFISSEKSPNAFGGRNFLLYKTDDYGSISDMERHSMEEHLPDYFERKLGSHGDGSFDLF